MREPWECASLAAEVLDGLGIRHAVVGGLAALRYRSEPRLTTDADLLIARTDGVVAAFESRGHRVDVIADEGEPPHLITVRGGGAQVDLIVALVDYQRVALDRAVDGVITAEDVVIHKLIAWRPRDRSDVSSILRSGRPLDRTYIEHWAREWEVEQRWAEAIDGTGTDT